MTDNQETADVALSDVEAELCRLPDVAAARIVTDHLGRPVEVHVLGNTGKQPKQVVRDVQSVALTSFGLELDRRIISVVQLTPDGNEPLSSSSRDRNERLLVTALDSSVTGVRATVRVTLRIGENEATGFAEGSSAAATRARLVAAATLDALRQLEPAADRLDIEAAQQVRVGGDDVLLLTLVCLDPPSQERLVGSALVRHLPDDATVRAVLDATNRRLPFLARSSDDS
jgi:hypothetical protein